MTTRPPQEETDNTGDEIILGSSSNNLINSNNTTQQQANEETTCSSSTINNELVHSDIENDSKKRKLNSEDEVFKFKPKFASWNEIPEKPKQIYAVTWNAFAKCARTTINELMGMDKNSRVEHMMVGTCLPTVFYLLLKESKGVFSEWSRNVEVNGMERKEECIQFAYTDGQLPCLDLYEDWGNFKIKIINNTCKFGQKVMIHHLKIKEISLTCNVNSCQVYTSFVFEKNIIL